MKKLIVALLNLCLILYCGIGLYACNKDNESDKKNSKVYSIYETYVTYAESKGDTPLSYEEWLSTIKGEDGKTPTIEISNDGYWVINGVKSVFKADNSINDFSEWRKSAFAKDYNGDHIINETDYSYYLESIEWKNSTSSFDFNGDSLIDAIDFKIYNKFLEWKDSYLAKDEDENLRIDEFDYIAYLSKQEIFKEISGNYYIDSFDVLGNGFLWVLDQTLGLEYAVDKMMDYGFYFELSPQGKLSLNTNGVDLVYLEPKLISLIEEVSEICQNCEISLKSENLIKIKIKHKEDNELFIYLTEENEFYSGRRTYYSSVEYKIDTFEFEINFEVSRYVNE